MGKSVSGIDGSMAKEGDETKQTSEIMSDAVSESSRLHPSLRYLTIDNHPGTL